MIPTYLSETENPNYTNTQAVKDALKEWRPGTDKHGYEFVRATYRQLRAHGSKARPMDDTIMRYLRAYGSLYGVKLKDRTTSLYHKEGIQECLF